MGNHGNEPRGFLGWISSALKGRRPTRAAAASSPTELELQARAAALELDLRERDERIARMKAEYEALQAARQRAEQAGGENELERLFKAICPSLANLHALCALAESGRQVDFGDVARLVRSLERELARAGLERIGEVGRQEPFDVALHQRMSGGSVQPGTPVVVQLPGYRMKEKVLRKAMVSAQLDTVGQERNNGTSGG